MNVSHVRARRVIAVAVATMLAVVGVGIATPASAATYSVTVHGTVLASEGTPGAEIPVQAYTTLGGDFQSYETTTDAAGEFTLAIESDDGWLDVYAGLARQQIELWALGGATETWVTLTMPVTVTVTVEGTVFDAYGAPLQGAWVSAWGGVDGSGQQSDAGGHYALTLAALVGGTIMINVNGAGGSTSAELTGFADGDVLHQDFTVGTGLAHQVEIVGTFVDAEGAPVPNAVIYVSSDRAGAEVTTDASGSFTQAIEYGEFGFVSLYADHAHLVVQAAELLGLSQATLVLQQSPPVHVTVSGHVTDLDGNFLANHLVVAYGETTAYMFTDASGFYSLEVLGDPFGNIGMMTEGGSREGFFIWEPVEGGLYTYDLVDIGDDTFEVEVPGIQSTCDVDGDGVADQLDELFYPTSGRRVLSIGLGEWGWGDAVVTLDSGPLDTLYCADLNGDGASELIAQGSHEKVKKSGTTVTKNDWWIYDYATDTATARTFPNGEISGVVFENLDALPGVEMIVERLRDAGPNTFWILDDATAEVEKVRVGFGGGGTLEFVDFDGVEGTDIVTTRVKPNGTLVTEYYTRASGQGEIVTVKTKAI